jgi:hybrid cluster-associated redox disulfide protein
MEPPIISSHLTAAEVMRRWPATVPVFIRYCALCVGCPFAPFETLAGIPAGCGVRLDEFICELQQTIDSTVEPTEPTARSYQEETTWQR